MLAAEEDQLSEVREEEVDELAMDPDHQALITTKTLSEENNNRDENLLPSTPLAYERRETSLTELSGGVGLHYVEYHDDV